MIILIRVLILDIDNIFWIISFLFNIKRMFIAYYNTNIFKKKLYFYVMSFNTLG